MFGIAIGAGGLRYNYIPSKLNQTQCHQRLATTAIFLRSCVAQELRGRDGPHYSLYALALMLQV